LSRAILLGLLLFWTACGSPSYAPVALSAEDMCAFCKMALSEKQYAAEFIIKDGEAFKFDDLGCLVNYIASKKNQAEIAAFYVMDYETQQWVKAETAFFVKSDRFHTPMSGGIIAYQDRAKAEAAAAAKQGKLMNWAEVLASGK
jgi:copper chaperone NosL